MKVFCKIEIAQQRDEERKSDSYIRKIEFMILFVGQHRTGGIYLFNFDVNRII